MKPQLILGDNYNDFRGTLSFNNKFDTSSIKKIYIIENADTHFVRAWRGHKIEQRWFSIIKGVFRIQLIKIDNWENPTRNSERITFEINSGRLDILHIPRGYVTSIQSLESNSRLLVMADYGFNEINDEFSYPPDYFYTE